MLASSSLKGLFGVQGQRDFREGLSRGIQQPSVANRILSKPETRLNWTKPKYGASQAPIPPINRG